jgi:hypothetical protein
VLEINPSAIKIAEEMDNERKRSGSRGLLHGIPILIKDNIATIKSEGKLIKPQLNLWLVQSFLRHEHHSGLERYHLPRDQIP